jgi:hypothetical protein
LQARDAIAVDRTTWIERLLSRLGTVSEIEEVAHKLLEQPSPQTGYFAANLGDILVQLQEMY